MKRTTVWLAATCALLSAALLLYLAPLLLTLPDLLREPDRDKAGLSLDFVNDAPAGDTTLVQVFVARERVFPSSDARPAPLAVAPADGRGGRTVLGASRLDAGEIEVRVTYRSSLSPEPREGRFHVRVAPRQRCYARVRFDERGFHPPSDCWARLPAGYGGAWPD